MFLLLFQVIGGVFLFVPTREARAAYTSGSLVLSINLDENSGITANDTSGNGLNGTVNGNPTWASGNIALDGIDDKIIVADNNLLDGPSQTYEVWFTMPDSSIWANLQGLNGRILDKTTNTNDSGSALAVLKDTRKLYTYFSGSTWSNITGGSTPGNGELDSDTVLNYSTLYHIVFTYEDATKIGELYVNGTLVTSGTTRGNYIPNAMSLAVGGRPEDNARNISGVVHRVSVYNKILSQDEVSANYAEGYNYNYTTPIPDPTAVSASQSRASSSLSSLPANGTTTSTVAVTVNNYLGNPLSGKTVTLSSSRGATDTITNISSISDANGQARFTVNSSTSGSPVLTAIAEGETISDTETITFTSGIATTTGVTYTSTLDTLALKMNVSYNSALANAPIILVLHGYSGPFSGDDIIQRFANKGLFAIQTYKRGYGGSQGVQDDGGREIHDFVDAVEYVKSHYAQYVDPSNINVVGYSGGGGNVYSLATKFPDYFRSANVFFGMSDYGHDNTYGWYNSGGTGYRTAMQNHIGGIPSVVPDSYYARDSVLAAKNNPYSHIQLFYDTGETVCPVSMANQYLNYATAAGLSNVTERISDAASTSAELNENYNSSLVSWLSSGTGSVQYTRNSSSYIDWSSNNDTTHDVLYKKFLSLRNYDKTDHFKSDFDFQVTSSLNASNILFGFRDSSNISTLRDSVTAMLQNNSGSIKLYSRIDYNGTALGATNRSLQVFTTTISPSIQYHLTIEVNNSVVTMTLKDSSLNTLETQILNFDGTKGFDGVDSFGIYDYNTGTQGGMVGTFDNLSVNAWARYIHGNPQEGNGTQEGDITAENYFVPDIVAGTWSQPSLLTSGTLFVPGYVKTNQFYLMLGNGNDEAGSLTYDISGSASTLATAKTFAVEGLTGTATTNLKVYNLSASTQYLVKDSNLTDGGSTLTSSITNSSGTLIFNGVLGSIHKYEVFQDTTSPASFTLVSPANNSVTSNRTPTFSWNASSDAESGFSKYQFYLDGVMDKDNIPNSSTSTLSSAELSCGNHTWYIKAIDNNNNTTNSNIFNLDINCAGGFISPPKPIVTPTDPTLGTVPSNITQIAISRTPDFTNVSWQPFDKDKFKNIDQATETLYVKFRTDQGAVSDVIIYEGKPSIINSNPTTVPLTEGDIVKTSNSPDVYVIKYKNNKQYKRLILSPLVFKSYQHLKWENIKIISQNQLDQYTTSNLVKETIDTIIYQLFPNGDIGERKAQDTSINYDSDSVYEINGVDRDSYKLVK